MVLIVNIIYIALERTFLAYIRTSVVIAMQGVVIAQLFRLQESPTDGDRLRFYQVGIPLSVTCYCVAIVVALIGAYRFWRQQNAIARGKVHAGGWELNFVGILFGLVSKPFFKFNITRILQICILTLCHHVDYAHYPCHLTRRYRWDWRVASRLASSNQSCGVKSYVSWYKKRNISRVRGRREIFLNAFMT